MFLKNNDVKLSEIKENTDKSIELQGTVKDKDVKYYPLLIIDSDQKLSVAKCSCNWYNQNKLYKGPCEHMLAIRMFYNKQISDRR